MYAWTARGDTPDTALLSAVDVSSPMFYVPEEVDEDETYEYLLTASADNAEDAAAEVTVTVLNKEALAVVCADPGDGIRGIGRYHVRLLGIRAIRAMIRSIRTPGRLGAIRRLRPCSALWTFPPRCSTYRRR